VGYRLEIDEFANSGYEKGIYASKLFGYVEDDSELSSYKYLKDNHILQQEFNEECVKNDTCFFGYGVEPKFVLSAEQFRQFMKLYEEDLRKFRDIEYINCLSDEEQIRYSNMLLSENPKMITWW
jgi:hypothetical protein